MMALLNDVLTLAKAGYKAKEIQELLKAVEEKPDTEPEQKKTEPENLEKEESKNQEPSEEPTDKDQNKNTDSKEDFEDSEMNKKYNDLLTKFKQLQKENVNKNIEKEKKSDEALFAEAFRDLF